LKKYYKISPLKRSPFVSVQGGRKFETKGILMYFEDFKFAPNEEMEQKEAFSREL
jgi:hypothetical protein